MTKEEYLQELPQEMRDFLKTCSRMKKFPFDKVFYREIPARDFGVLKETVDLIRANDSEVRCVRVSSIVKKMHVPAPLVSRNLKSLESKKLVIRETDVGDRRNTLVYVTDKGYELIHKSDSMIIDFMTDVVNEMGNDEMRNLTASMSRFLDCMEHEAAKRMK